MFSVKRLKKKSQSVDIPGFLLSDPPSSPVTKATPSVIAKTTSMTTEERDKNSTNQRVRSSPRRGELKRGYTIDTGQKGRPERDKKDIRRISFQRPRGTMEYSVETRDTLNSIALKFDTTPNELVTINKLFSRAVVPGKVLYVPDPDYVSSVESSPSLSPISPLSPTSSEPDLGKESGPAQVHPRQSRVVSSTSEEEEALTEKFLKINCKYITDGKADVLVQEHGCEEYGIMCPLEELMSAAMCTDVTDPRVRELVPLNLELPPAGPEPGPMRRVPRSNLEDSAQRANDSASTAPRSTEASLSEDVFTESELSPVRDDAAEPRQEKTYQASSESLQTVTQATDASQEAPNQGQPPKQDPGLEEASGGAEDTARTVADGEAQDCDTSAGLRREDEVPRVETTTTEHDQLPVFEEETKSRTTSESQGSETVAADVSVTEGCGSKPQTETQPHDSLSEMEQLRKLWESHAMPSTYEQLHGGQLIARETATANQEQSEEERGSAEGPQPPGERRRWGNVRFLCVRVGRPMRKTFLSQASASMQQYAQRDRKKHEYWFAVPPERSDQLFAFFVQWSPEAFEEEGGAEREPGFVVVKKNREAERGSDKPPVPDITSKDWEVVSRSEYQRRIDALNSDDLRSLCRRLQITTKDEASQQHRSVVRSDLEPEVFRPTLSDPSDLLSPDQIEKLAKHLPPRTIGYPWTLAFSTARNGMSIKTLYRCMTGLDTPVLMVIRDSDGQVFGALASEPLKVSDGFYGTGETLLFTFCPEFEVFKWTGDNMFFLKGDMDSLAFGGGGGEFGLWLDGDLYHGRSNPCKTFGNPRLSKREDFVLQDIEIWAFE